MIIRGAAGKYMTDYTSKENRLIIEGTKVQFPYSIGEVIEVEDVIVIRLKVPTDENYARNVWAFDSDGSPRWKIEPPEDKEGIEQPYADIGFTEEKGLWAYNWNSIEYTVDIKTGELVDSMFRK